ncbi:hypothetical protein O9992_27200 [Vibrio lentus]|nr:hypothetical protein [Vibrio lentus]
MLSATVEPKKEKRKKENKPKKESDTPKPQRTTKAAVTRLNSSNVVL